MTEGLNPLPVFVASLKDPVSAGTLETVFAGAPPAVVINATSFAVSAPQSEFSGTPLDRPGAPVLQAVFSGGTEEAWREGLNGLSARDIAMNVALPEIDGRILTRAVSFKTEAYFDEATECRIATYRAEGSRVQFVARQAAGWARLAAKARADRRVAIILANYPNRDGRLANGVGLDTPASAVGVLAALEGAGYRVHDRPADSADLMARIEAGPTNWLTDRARRSGGETLSLADYHLFHGELPWEVRRRIEDRWGKPEQDPFYAEGEVDCGRFALSILPFGNVVIGVQPARGYNVDPKDTYHSPDLVPPHNYLAFHAWLRDVFRADAIIHLGKHGNLEWLPGKSLALSDECFPGSGAGSSPAPLSLHRQRPRRGHAGQAQDLCRHPGSFDPTADACRDLRAPEGTGGAGRRVLRGVRGGPPPPGSPAPRDPVAGRGRAAGRGCRDHVGHGRGRRAPAARHLSLRAEGEPDPGRAARLWCLARW